MTFTTKIKDEITKNFNNEVESRIELITYLKYVMELESNKLTLYIENASVARYIFKLIKKIYNINITLTIRTLKRFKLKTIYILTLKEKLSLIKNEIDDLDKYIKDSSKEEMAAYLKAVFLSCGSINDPSKSKYHLEFLIENNFDAKTINYILNFLNFHSKIIRREKGYMVYIKISEEISDFIKLLGATNSLFYYEDIRIYRDHKNMVNRLNNCEQANIEKSVNSCREQLENIKYLKDFDLIDLLDDKIKMTIEYREKYPETTLSELANIISLETEYKISKSGINHYFRKIKELVNKHKNIE